MGGSRMGDQLRRLPGARAAVHRVGGGVGLDPRVRPSHADDVLSDRLHDYPWRHPHRARDWDSDWGAQDDTMEEDKSRGANGPINRPLVVTGTGKAMEDPNRWQPLQLEHMISQNGIPVADGVQTFVGPHWGHVTGFALPDGGADGLPLAPGAP